MAQPGTVRVLLVSQAWVHDALLVCLRIRRIACEWLRWRKALPTPTSLTVCIFPNQWWRCPAARVRRCCFTSLHHCAKTAQSAALPIQGACPSNSWTGHAAWLIIWVRLCTPPSHINTAKHRSCRQKHCAWIGGPVKLLLCVNAGLELLELDEQVMDDGAAQQAPPFSQSTPWSERALYSTLRSVVDKFRQTAADAELAGRAVVFCGSNAADMASPAREGLCRALKEGMVMSPLADLPPATISALVRFLGLPDWGHAGVSTSCASTSQYQDSNTEQVTQLPAVG